MRRPRVSNFVTNGRRAGHTTGGTEGLKLSEAASASVVFTLSVKVDLAATPA